MEIEPSAHRRNVLTRESDRPALKSLIGAMERLSRPQRNEVVHLGRKARAARVPRIRRLTWQAVAEARRLALEAAQ